MSVQHVMASVLTDRTRPGPNTGSPYIWVSFSPANVPCPPFSLPRCFRFPSPRLPRLPPRQPGMNLPGHVEPCQKEAKPAIHHPALPACHCSSAAFCVCRTAVCLLSELLATTMCTSIPSGPPVKTERGPSLSSSALTAPRGRLDGWMESRQGRRVRQRGRGTQLSQNAAVGGV